MLEAPQGQAGGVSPGDGLTCADLDAHAIDSDPRAARALAETTLAARLKDTRGDMLTAGIRKLRYEVHPPQCEVIGGPFGGIHCKAVGSVCGRPLSRP